RVVRCAVEGERRPDRTDQRERFVGRPAKDRGRVEGRRRQRDRAKRARVPAVQARNRDANRDDGLRSGARADQRPRLHRQAPRRVTEVPRQAAQPGDHRVEEPGDQARVRRRVEAAAGRGDGASAAMSAFPPERANRETGFGAESRITTPESPWFAIWTRSRHEQVVREQLERKHFEAFLPTITRWSRWKDRKKKIDWPLFPGYCFARFDPADALPVLKCTGVVNIVSFEGKPAAI